jgi:integrase
VNEGGKMEKVERRKQRPRGEGTTFLVGRFWYVEFSDRPGHRVQVSSRSTKRSVAEQLRRRLVAEVEEGRFTSQTRRLQDVTFGELCGALLDDYRVYRRKTLRETEGRLKLHLLPFFGAMRAVDIGTDRILAYIRKRQEEGAADGSIQLELAGFKRAFRLAAESTPPRVLRVPHVPSLRLDNVRRGFLEHEQYRRLRDALPGYLRGVLATGYFVGLRAGEIRGLQWRQVDLPGGQMRLEAGTTKSGEPRTVPLVGELSPLLRMQLELHRTECADAPACGHPVFTRGGRPIVDFRAAWERACREAGVPGLLFHDLRRSAVRNLVRAGVPERVAMTITGHKTRSVFDRYDIVSPRDLMEAAAKVERYLGEERPVALLSSGGGEDGKDEPTN